MGYLRRAFWIAAKDLRLEWRNLEKLSSMLFFAILLLVVLHMSFDFSKQGFAGLGAGVLWVCITFAGMVGLGHSFVLERDQGCLQSLKMCPGDRSAIYLGKFLSNGVFVLVVEAVVLPLAAFLFNYDLLPVLLPVATVMLLYTLGFVALGTFFSAMSTATRRGEVLLSIMVFPFLLPVIMVSVRAAGRLLAGWELADVGTLLIFNICYDVIILVVSLMLFEYVIEE
jgi:heme exporter protein B